MSLALSGCGGGSDPETTTTKDFQTIGTGACRTADDTPGEFDCNGAADKAACTKVCADDAKCTALEWTTAVDADSTCKGTGGAADKQCEIHKKIMTKVESADHPNHECIRKVEIVDFKVGGACRTADDKEGDFTCEDLDAAACKAKCLSDVTCTAYEMTEAARTGDCEGKKCELHTTAITKTDRTDDHTTHHCFAVNPVKAEAEMFAV